MRKSLYSAGMCLVLAVQVAQASTCMVQGPAYQLASDTIEWTLRARAGQTCIRGLRGATVILRNVELVEAPKSGVVAVHGPGFTFRANADAAGQDAFSLKLSGTMNGLDGSSIIVIRVLYNSPE